MIDRRHVLALLAGSVATPALAQTPGMSRMTAYAFSFSGLNGGDIRLADYAGKPIMVVNTASLCGYTPQYAGLQALWTRYRDRGLVIVGVPSNDFGAQEPKTEPEIAKFCETNFGVTFPMTAKQKVVGADAHGLYQWISGEGGEAAAPKWNFHKYLIDKTGKLVGSWPSRVSPTSPEITKQVDMMLAG